MHELEPFAKMIGAADKNGDGKLQQDESPSDLAKEWFGFVNLDGDDTLNEQEWDYFRAALRFTQQHDRHPPAGSRCSR